MGAFDEETCEECGRPAWRHDPRDEDYDGHKFEPEDDPLEDFAQPIGTGMRDAGPGLPGIDMSDPDDHGIVRRLP